MSCEDRYVEVNLVHMFFMLLKKWRSLIVAVFVGVLVGLIVVNIRAYISKEEDAISTKEKHVEFDALQSANDEAKEYLEKSLLMNMNGQHLYRGCIRVYIENCEDIELLTVRLKNILEEETLYNTIREKTNLEFDTKYLKEIITVKCDEDVYISNESSSSENVVNNLVVNENEKNIACLSYIVVFDDKQTVNEIVALLEQMLDMMIYSENEVNPVCRITLDRGDCLEFQTTEYIMKKNCILKEMDSNKKMMETVTPRAKFQFGSVECIKYMFSGFVVGLLVWGCFWVMYYLFDGTLKTIDDVKRISDCVVFGIKDSLNQNKVDKIIEKIEGRVVDWNYVDGVIKTLSTEKEVFFYCMDAVDMEHYTDRKQVKQGYMHSDFDLLKSASNKDVVLLLKLNKTKVNNFLREIDMAELLGCRVVGVLCG